MREVYVIGVGSTRFARHLDKDITTLTAESLEATLKDAGVGKKEIQSAWFGNFAWGIFSGQHSIKGQIALRPLGIDSIPIINVENACATASTAFHGAWKDVACGLYDVALAIGTEKIYHVDKAKTFQALEAGVDVEHFGELAERFNGVATDIIPPEYLAKSPAAGTEKSFAMDAYSGWTRHHMRKYGTTQRQLAVISSKNHHHGALNPFAQYQKEMTVEEVLADKMISYPLTRAMCSPVADGSAAAIVCSKDYLQKLTNARPVKVRASILGSGSDRKLDDEKADIVYRLSRQAYEVAGLGPEDLDIAEVHDATAYGEIQVTEAIGLCPFGEGGPLAESGATTLGGRIPVNLSGGLESRGHPIGATGLGQIHELVVQLRGEAGQRQTTGARIGLAENGGGIHAWEPVAMCVHIFEGVKK